MENLFPPHILPGKLPARLVETFEALGLPYDADLTRQRLDSDTSDQRELVAAFERGGALYLKNNEFNGPIQKKPMQEIGMSYTSSLSDGDGQHYKVKWVFSRLEHLLWVQAMPTP